MTKQYLGGWRTALVGAAVMVMALAGMTNAFAAKSIHDRGGATMQQRTGTTGDDASSAVQSRLYSRASYEWPYSSGPYYGEVENLDEPGVITTPVGAFKLGEELPFPAELRTRNRLGEGLGAQYFFVFSHPELDVQQEIMAAIEAAGGAVIDPRPNGVLVARLNSAAFAAIHGAIGVMGIEPYHPAFKLAPEIGRIPLSDPLKATSDVYTLEVSLWPGENGQAVAKTMAELGANVLHVWDDQLGVEAPRALLPKLAALEPVAIIRESLPNSPLGEETTTTMQTGALNAHAIPYHDAGVNGGGNGFGFCADNTTICKKNFEPINCGGNNQANNGSCNLSKQVLMIIDSGIQLDAGDLSNTRTTPGTVGATHRKVRIYESTNQYGASPGGDLLGCDAPAQGGFTHGHMVAATALGNATAVPAGYGAGFSAFDTQGNPWKLDGVAPGAVLVALDAQITPPTVSCADPLTNAISPGDLFQTAVENDSGLGEAYNVNKARIFNFSWGQSANTYNADADDIDRFIQNHPDALVFVAAGNNGADVVPTGGDGISDELTLGAPATTKNGLAIGASRNTDTTPQQESREAFSSVGPAVNTTTVFRIAPQLMAPGGEAGGGTLGIASEFSCRSADNDQLSPVQCDIISGVEGTSFSSPAAAGAALLVRDYFFQGFYPNKTQNTITAHATVSSALVKAVLIASADFMTGANLSKAFRFNNEQGYGRIELDKALPLQNWPKSPSGLIVHDTLGFGAGGTTNFSDLGFPATISSGGSSSKTFTVCSDTEELRIAMAWVDAAPVAGAGDLRNNLNLQVISPSGKTYRGNYFTDDANHNGILAALPAEDCPPIGGLAGDNLINSGQWSLPICANSAVPLSGSPVATSTDPFDRKNNTEAIFLSPDPDGNSNFNDGTCTAGSSKTGGINGLGLCGNNLDCDSTPATPPAPTDQCANGKKQPEIGTWTAVVTTSAPFTGTPQTFAMAIAGGVCLGSSVRFDKGFYTCNEPAKVTVSEKADVADVNFPTAGVNCTALGSCPLSTIQARTTVRVRDTATQALIDCEGPGCTPANPGLTFTQPNVGALIFESANVSLTDGTVPQAGNGVLDIRDGNTIEVTYGDFGATRQSSAVVGCQVAVGFGSIQFAQFGQDQSVLVNGGCERAAKRSGQTQGFFEFGYPDRYMDADEVIQFDFAFNSDETTDLEDVTAALTCVNVDADSPAECLPNGSGCDTVACGGTCDPRRLNNTPCPYMSILDSPKLIGTLPAGAAISANFAIQMADDPIFSGNPTPTIEMILEVTAAVSGRTSSGLAVSRQRLNVDETTKLYNTDFPTGGTATYDYDNNEVASATVPLTDLSGFQGLDYRFETRTFSDLTAGKDVNGNPVSRNLGLLAPWNFDGNDGGFSNGLASNSDEAAANVNHIANWGEDKNFNGFQDGQCAANSSIACYDFPNDARCPGGGTCNSIEDNNLDGNGTANFSQNWNNKGGCGWQTRPPLTCLSDPTRGCFVHAGPLPHIDCAGTCQQEDNELVSTFTACGSGAGGAGCSGVKQCSNGLNGPVTASPPGNNAPCSINADCTVSGGSGQCVTVSQNCVGDAGTCTGAAASTGGVWHTGRIGTKGVGVCDGSAASQCTSYKVISTTANTLLWWDQLLTPVMEKVDQSKTLGVNNSKIEIAYWAWNQSTNLSDNNVAYSWEFDTDTSKIVPVDLVADGTALEFAVGPFGSVASGNNPALANGFSLFAPMGRCSISTGTCQADIDCPPTQTCVQSNTSVNGLAGTNRSGQNSCFFEGPGTIPAANRDDLGFAKPKDDDLNNGGAGTIDEFVTAAGPIRNHDIVAYNGPDMRFGTLEDIFGDTGNTFQGSLGFVSFEGTTSNPATPSYGIAVDDMYVEWKEFKLDPDVTDCATGSCAAMEVPTTNIYDGNAVLTISLLDTTPYNHACSAGVNQVCYTALAAPGGCGSCIQVTNDCDLDGDYVEAGDDNDCDNNGVPDVVVRATSDAEVSGEIVILNRVSPSSNEYRGNLTISLLSNSPGVLYLAENGAQNPVVTVTYIDDEDGTGHLCQNNVVPANQGHVVAGSTIFHNTCDVKVVGTSFVDNGDGDFFADSKETVTLSFTLQNNCGIDLTGCVARLSTNSPEIECITKPIINLGTLADLSGAVVPAADSFIFKVSAAADRTTHVPPLTPNSAFDATFNISISCVQIDGLEFPQNFSIPLDLNLSDLGQTPFAWLEGFEGGVTLAATKFSAENLDFHIPGANNTEGLVNGNGWRCQYSDPDWVNAGAYGDDAALDCFPDMNLAHADAVFWQLDGTGVPGPAHTGRAKTGSKSMYYGVFLTTPAGEFSTPLATVESAASTTINLGVGNPQLSFWHQVTLADHRMVAPVPPLRSADRGVIQVRTFDAGNNPTSPWTKVTPIQNSYDEQAEDNFFNCTFDPVDDGNNEDNYFDPTDPDRDTGPSSTCFPAFTYGFHGDTNDAFSTTNIGNSTTPPQASDSPILGVGTWVQTKVDLSPFRGRRARVRYLVSSIKATQETWAQQFPTLNPGPQDDGWWIDDVEVNQALTNPAQILNDDFPLGSCSGDPNDSCVNRCSVSNTPCSTASPCGGGQGICLNACPGAQTCTGPAPGCGSGCTLVTANIYVLPVKLLNPSSVTTSAPGQVVSFNAAAVADAMNPAATPSVANSCLSGGLQYQFCISGDPDGGGAGLPDADCDDAEDTILRGWTENAFLAQAPQQSGTYVVEVRCSTQPSCKDTQQINVTVNCPGGVNALALADTRATDPSNASGTDEKLTWSGAPLTVDFYKSTAYTVMGGIQNYPGTFRTLTSVTCAPMSDVVTTGQVIAYLVKADGPVNTVPVGYFCNSKTWRSGGASEVPERVCDGTALPASLIGTACNTDANCGGVVLSCDCFGRDCHLLNPAGAGLACP